MAEPQATANQWNILRTGMYAFPSFGISSAVVCANMGSFAGALSCIAFGGIGMAYCAIIAGRVALRRPEITPPDGGAENAVGKPKGQTRKKAAKAKSSTDSKANPQGWNNAEIIERVFLDDLVFDELCRDTEPTISFNNDKKETTQLEQVFGTHTRDENTKEIAEYSYDIRKLTTNMRSNYLYSFSQN